MEPSETMTSPSMLKATYVSSEKIRIYFKVAHWQLLKIVNYDIYMHSLFDAEAGASLFPEKCILCG
jgi:hypothetical protein